VVFGPYAENNDRWRWCQHSTASWLLPAHKAIVKSSVSLSNLPLYLTKG